MDLGRLHDPLVDPLVSVELCSKLAMFFGFIPDFTKACNVRSYIVEIPCDRFLSLPSFGIQTPWADFF